MISAMRKLITIWHVFQPLEKPLAAAAREPTLPLNCIPAPPGDNYDSVNYQLGINEGSDYTGQWLGKSNQSSNTQVLYRDHFISIYIANWW